MVPEVRRIDTKIFSHFPRTVTAPAFRVAMLFQQGTFAPDMLLYCERLRLLHRLAPGITPSGAGLGDSR